MQCKMKYIQSLCNTGAAMKFCETETLLSKYCMDTIAECRNMTFENNNSTLAYTYAEYTNYSFNPKEKFHLNNGEYFNKRCLFQCCVLVLLFLLTR